MRLFFIISLFLCSSLAIAKPLVLNELQRENLGIKTSAPEHSTQTLSLRYPAKVVIPNAAQRVVNTIQAGVLVSLMLAEGDAVHQGDLLAIINSPDLILLQKSFLQAQSKLDQLNQNRLRDKQLFEEGIIAERRYLESKTLYIQQQTDVDSLIKTLKLSGMSAAAIDLLRKQRDLNSELHIYAPADGIIMRQMVIPGQRLNAAEPIYQIADLSQLWLEIHVPIDFASTLKKQNKVNVCERGLSGEVITIGRQVHEIDQGVLVRALVDEKTDQLVPGEFTEVCFVSSASEQQFSLPRSAIFNNQGQQSVFILDGDTVKLLPVIVLNNKSDSVLLTADISTDTAVVTEGVAALKAAWLAENGE